MKIRKDVALLPTRTLFFTSFFPPNMSNFSPLCLKEGIICLTVCPNPFFFSFNFKVDEKNNDGEEREVQADKHPKGQEEHYEEEEEEEDDGAAVAEKSQRRAEMQLHPEFTDSDQPTDSFQAAQN